MSWIIAAVIAAFSQNIRTLFQKQLTRSLSPVASAFGRFLYAWPFAIVALLVYLLLLDGQVPTLKTGFWFWVVLGSIVQSGFTIALSQAFRFRNFAVAVTFTKTAVVQAAVFEMLLLRTLLTPVQWLAIAISSAGVLFLSATKSKMGVGAMLRSLASPACAWGLAGGAMLGLSGVFFRAATLSLEGSSVGRALFVLCVGLTLQVIYFTIYLMLKERDQLIGLLRVGWRGVGIGGSGALGSACWFFGYSLAPAALVNAVGQVELLFAFLTGRFFFGERSTRGEIIGLILVGSAVIMILLS